MFLMVMLKPTKAGRYEAVRMTGGNYQFPQEIRLAWNRKGCRWAKLGADVLPKGAVDIRRMITKNAPAEVYALTWPDGHISYCGIDEVK